MSMVAELLESKLTHAESTTTQLLSAAVRHLLNEGSRKGAKPRREQPSTIPSSRLRAFA